MSWLKHSWVGFSLLLSIQRGEEKSLYSSHENESLYNARERYKKLLKRCPMHGIDQIMQMDIFYHAMNYTSNGIIDAACCGAFKRKSAKEANKLIEDLAKSNIELHLKLQGAVAG